MKRKCLVMLVLVAFAAGGAFAQDDQSAPPPPPMPKNTFTVDVGPLILGLGSGFVLNVVDDDLSSSGFGIAAQFERNLAQRLSMALRFAYLSLNMEYTDVVGGSQISVDAAQSSFSVEGHLRLYPFGETFFLDGMLGYANLSSDFEGAVNVSGQRRPVDFNESGNYLKLGAKLGWRISLGANGGFTIEPSVGYYHAIPLGDSVGKQFSDYINGNADVVDTFELVEKFIFTGGPRASLGFGWRF